MATPATTTPTTAGRPRFVPESVPLVLRLGQELRFNDEELFELCRKNREWRIERSSEGDLLIMAPTGGETGKRNLDLSIELGIWSREDGTGIAFDSSTGFVLPNGAMRAPDASWVRRDRLAGLTPEEKRKFLPLCPDFVAELCSPSDLLPAVEEKMEEYLASGARLGWLIEPDERRVTVYAPGVEPTTLNEPATLSGDPVLPGFVLELDPIWEGI